MAYTVTELAKMSKVSVRTLHWYDELGLLKPAYYGSNGYRYYEEEQLLTLQQILFFRELGFELKQIEKLLKRSDFDRIVALSSHRKILVKNLDRTKKLINTIDKTLEHLKGKNKMNEIEMYHGFDKEKQAVLEKQLIDRFGDRVKIAIHESHQRIKGWKKADWEKSNKEFDAICQELTKCLKEKNLINSDSVQKIIVRHHIWMSQFWKPDKKAYKIHSQIILDSELRNAYEGYHPQLPEFIAEAIQYYSDHNLE